MVGNSQATFTQQDYQPVRPSGHRPGGMRISFSHVELRHIGIATAVLTLAIWVWFGAHTYLLSAPIASLLVMVVAFVAVVSGFLMHEMGHKFTAQYFGCWAEFRYSQWGLAITLLTAWFGFLFAIPGAVYFSGSVTRKQNGMIGLAGPMVNLVTSIILWPLVVVLAVFGSGPLAILSAFLGILLVANAFLGAFNMIPFGPLDGRKVWGWTIPGYVAMMGVMIVNVVAAYIMVF